MMRIRGAAVHLVLAATLVAGPALGAGAAPEEAGGNADPAPVGGLSTPELIERAVAIGEIDRSTANLYLAFALARPDELPAAYRSDVPWSGTLPLLRLRLALQASQVGTHAEQIEQILEGPDSVTAGSCGGTSGGSNTHSTTNFHIEYGTIAGGLTINDYATSLETSWSTEITSFGWWAPPVKTSNPPPGNRYHVVVANLGSGLYGFVSSSGTYAGFEGNNPNTSWSDGDAYASCMALNRDYSGFPGTPQQALDATTAHEFNHSIQFGVGGLAGTNTPDDAFIEGGATWMEDEVFDHSDDNHNYLWPDFTRDMGQYTASPYPYWVVFRAITERYGAGVAGGGEQVMQDFWEETSRNTGNNLTAMQTGLANKGATLADAYHGAAVALKFNRACGGGYVYPYCLEEGPDYVAAAGNTPIQGTIGSVGGSFNGSVRDNYALNWVALPSSGSTYNLTLSNTSAGGQLRASAVCDAGSALVVSAFPAVVGAGGSTTLTGFNPGGCVSRIAVITNQSQTAANPSSSSLRSYTLSTAAAGGTGADLSIVKTDSPDPVTVGNTLTYTAAVTNGGPSSASSVSVTDILPAAVSFVSSSSTQGSCSGTSTVTCSLGTLANGQSETVTIQVTPNSAGGLSNTATVSSSTSDPNTGNNSSTATSTVESGGGDGDVDVTVADFSFTPKALSLDLGDTVEWNFNGPSTHTATEKALGLFDSGNKGPGATYSFTFAAAGAFAYRCDIHPKQMKGNVKVPIVVTPGSGSTTTTFTVTWASGPLPAGFVVDVQVQRPGQAFVDWNTGQTALSSSFVPDSGTGKYSFRARLRNPANGKASKYSKAASITVT